MYSLAVVLFATMLRVFKVSILLCLLHVSCSDQNHQAGCTVSINNDITDPQPLLLRPEGGDGNDAFFLPQNGDVISFDNGQIVELACLGGNLRINGVPTGRSIVDAICIGHMFQISNQTVPFSSISCSRYPVHQARHSGATCLGDHREVALGFAIGERFIKLITSCFDKNVQTTLYTVFEMPYAIEGFQRGFPRPAWTQSDCYDLSGIPLNTLYMRNRQRITINRLLGLELNSTKYIHATNNFFLARGHLAAKADFIFGAQHRVTFYFLNAAPQWQTFNGANWKVLEQNCRDFVSSRRLTVLVYTGTHGVTTLPHAVTGEETELFLYVDENANTAIPVPQFYWKVLYDPTTKAGVAFIGLNNPYQQDVSQHIICKDICDEINWLRWSPKNIQRGYSYCCSVDDFRKVVKTLPDFEVELLLS